MRKAIASKKTTIKQPPFLSAGDLVAIVAPARKINIEELENAIKLFESWKLKVVLGKNIFHSYNQFAGTDLVRSEDMQWAIDHKAIKAIFCARGGYGCVRIIDHLDFSEFLKHPKWIAGFSDVTVFHSHLHNKGIASLHAAMPYNISKSHSAITHNPQLTTDNRQLTTLYNALFGKKLNYKINANPLNRRGTAGGIIVGGNLSILYALNGSFSDIDAKGKILFIEDIDEYLYHIDRMMMNMKRSGKLAHLAGLIVGGMTDMKDNKVAFNKTAEEIISEAVAEYNYPVCFNFPAGHIDNNSALILGAKVELKIDGKVSLNFN
jgi:muramoyltetrapeptide carboxypeptidase